MRRRPAGAPPAALARCVGDPDRFLAEEWTRRPHLKRRGGADDFGDLLSLAHVDRILATTSLRWPAFRLVRDGAPLPRASYTRAGTVGGRRIDDLIDVGRVHAHFDDGATIVLQGLNRYWEPVTRFCRELELFLTHPLQANAYITPPVASGLNVHHDTHDVFALQTHGRKHWVVYEPVIAQPLTSQRWSSTRHDPGEPVLDLDLQPGDCLYVPRGTPHAAQTVDAASVHLTLGVRATTWHDVLSRVVAGAADELRFREALPAGYARDPRGLAGEITAKLKELAAWLEEVDAGQVADTTAEAFWGARPPMLDGQLAQLLALDRVSDDTEVVRRPGNVCQLRVRDGRLRLVLGDRVVELPAVAEPAVRRVLDRERLRVGELADLLDESGRQVLVRRLIREGVIAAEQPR